MRELKPIAPQGVKSDFLAELAGAEILVDTHPAKNDRGFFAYRAIGRDIPHTLNELGRLREETFRSVGEGTGLERDIDRFDQHYDHFIVLDKSRQEISGAYRIGRVDEILATMGRDGLYINTFFDLDSLLESDFRQGTLEAGRSFVRAEYQRGPTLMLVWTALARFIAAHPRYYYMIGPVSISDEFHENSKHLMVSYLMKYHPHEKSDMVVPKNPPQFDSNLTPEEITEIIDNSINLKSLQESVRQTEGNPKAQIPQLIKLYLELGVRFLAFNKDIDFNSIDGLIWLDVRQIPPPIVTRFMGEENWDRYCKFHELATR